VVVNKILEGGIIGRTRMQQGFIITSVNGENINSVEELSKMLANLSGPASVEGIYPGYDGTYKYPLNLE
jgi:S1-C subfamily serine protease